jgi:hypothetical protein
VSIDASECPLLEVASNVFPWPTTELDERLLP